jgi:hypothetical protein
MGDLERPRAAPDLPKEIICQDLRLRFTGDKPRIILFSPPATGEKREFGEASAPTPFTV